MELHFIMHTSLQPTLEQFNSKVFYCSAPQLQYRYISLAAQTSKNSWVGWLHTHASVITFSSDSIEQKISNYIEFIIKEKPNEQLRWIS